MDTALILTCLGIMLKGMIGIFVVIVAIWGLVALLNYLTSDDTAAWLEEVTGSVTVNRLSGLDYVG